MNNNRDDFYLKLVGLGIEWPKPTSECFDEFVSVYRMALNDALWICTKISNQSERFIERDRNNTKYYEAKRNGSTHCEREILEKLAGLPK